MRRIWETVNDPSIGSARRHSKANGNLVSNVLIAPVRFSLTVVGKETRKKRVDTQFSRVHLKAKVAFGYKTSQSAIQHA